MTQSGVSQHIAQIEEILGVALFERVGRKVLPTQAADKLYSFGGAWLSQMHDFAEEIRMGEQQISGRVCVGAPGSFGVFLLPYLIEWQKKNPGILLDMEYGPRNTKEKALLSGKMDLAISGDPFDPRYFSSEEFYKQEFVLVSHPSLKPQFHSWEDFKKNPIVDYAGSESIFQKWTKSHFRKSVSRISELNVRIKTNNLESIFYLLEQKVGVTIFPSEPLIPYVKAKKLKIHSTEKTVSNSLYLVQRKGQILSRRVEDARKIILSTSNL
jgi:DNA-binding transcriptional LysR family regulator